MSRLGNKDNYVGTAAGRGFIDPRPTPVADNIKRLCEKVAQSFDPGKDVTDITDRFFEYIEKHPSLLEDYKNLEQNIGKLSLNAQIGRWIRDKYRLGNGDVVPARRSKLIQAYTTHSQL